MTDVPPGLPTWGAADARRHPPPDLGVPGHWWHERWAFDVWSSDGRFGASTCLTVLPGRGHAWYWSALVQPDTALLAVWDLEAPIPRQGLTLRSHGLWAEHVCEEPLRQWTVANECHAVRLDDPEEALRRGHGEQAAMAFDLEWYGTTSAVPAEAGVDAGSDATQGWSIDGEAHGVIELGGGASVAVDGLPARYRRTWGALPYRLTSTGPATAAAGGASAPSGRAAPVPLVLPSGPAALRRVLTADGWWEGVEAPPA
jgi:hypothetical protein